MTRKAIYKYAHILPNSTHQYSVSTSINQTMEEGGQTAKRRKVLLVSLIAVCALTAAVVVPIIVLTRKEDTNDGEHIVELSELVEVSLLERRAGEDILLSDLYSSEPTTVPADLSEILINSNSSNATYFNSSNSSFSPAPTESQTGSPAIVPVPAETETNSPTESPTRTSVPAPQIVKMVDSFQVLETIPHDRNAFTQGLTFDPLDSNLVYESTGLYGQSDVRKVDIRTGEVLLLAQTPNEVFGEGLAYYTEETRGDPATKRLIHITWQSQRGFIFNADTLDTLQEFQFESQRNEGWGITYNPNTDQFIVTDGSEYLHFWFRSNLTEIARVPVMMQVSEESPPMAITNLNEIEWDDETGTVLSNVWQTDNIVRIDPKTGKVVTMYNLSELYTDRELGSDVLNGIAISPEKELWVTGKLWPNMYKIVFNE